ncbi:MAG: efflux RND transporter permease subunit [Candidatus Eiseniibacteriota bacterium]|nr:MAG: efflux RND transporter permease subunit [Candidatus Eisenbacteria bacterium]
MNIARLVIRSPVTTIAIVFTLFAAGILSISRLPLAFLPDVDFPQLYINVPYPNAVPSQVQEEITRPLEEALSTMSRLKRIYSYSDSDGSNIFLEFDWGVDIDVLRVEAREKIDRVQPELPDDVDQIYVQGFSSSDIPILILRVASGRDLSKSYDLIEKRIVNPLRQVPGVAQVRSYGVEKREISIELDLDRVKMHSVDVADLLSGLTRANRNVSAGRVNDGDDRFSVRVLGDFKTLGEIQNFPVTGNITLQDIADIRYEEPKLDYGRHLDRERAVGIEVMKESGYNTVKVARAARERLKEIGEDPALEGLSILTFLDLSEQILNGLNGLLQAGLLGALLACVVLYFFLRNVAATLAIGLAIPFSVVSACVFIFFAGRSLNILSMMGLMISVGMLVDNAVVVLESIFRHRQSGAAPADATVMGTREVLPAVVTSTLTTIIVFLPLTLGARTEISVWISETGKTIFAAILCSLLVSVTLIPLFMHRFGHLVRERSSDLIRRLTERYQRFLTWSLAHRWKMGGIMAAVFLSMIFPFMKMEKSAFSGIKVEDIPIRYEFSENVNHIVAERYVNQVEEFIVEHSEELHLKSLYSVFADNYAMTRVYPYPEFTDEDNVHEIRKILREGLPKLPGVELKLGGLQETRREGRISVNIFGDAGPTLMGLADEAARRLAFVRELKDIDTQRERGREEIQVVIDRELVAHKGLSSVQVASAVAMFFRGVPVSRFRGPEGEVEIWARVREEDRQNLENLQRLTLANMAGEAVPLSSVARFTVERGPAQIERQQRKTVAVVTAHYEGSDTPTIRKRISRVLSEMSFPAGYSWSYGGFFEEESATQQELLVNMVLALILVYVVMASLFESLVHPFAIMFALPFAFVGVSWLLFSTGTPFNIMAQIGLLILIGIVVNNGIVLIYQVHCLREAGMERTEAIIHGAGQRLRPVLMTAATTVLGLTPLALGRTAVGDAMYYPMARCVIGGLVASSFLTVVIVPSLYGMLEDWTNRVRRIFMR